MGNHLIHHIGELMTLEPLVRERRYFGIQPSDLGLVPRAWLAITDGTVVEYGSDTPPERFRSWPSFDAKGALVTPGLVDCHTHPIFGGDRTHEFAAQLNGSTYQQIAAQGGGIKSTIRATRQADSETLFDRCLKHARDYLQWGVTSFEAKSGYGQSVEEELRLLRILQQVKLACPQTVAITCLALHDLPQDISDKAEFIRQMSEDLLPTVAREKLADWVDAFVENGYFSVVETEALVQAAQQLGLGLRLHADEFADSGAAAAAARWGAVSADHLQKASDDGLRAMSQAGTVAVLLPGTSFYTKIPYAQAERFRTAGCTIAVASDFNPGSCYIANLPFAAGLAALYCGLSVAETLVAVTWNAARALRLETHKGALVPGYDGDLVIHSMERHEQWIADLGQNRPQAVMIAGDIVWEQRVTKPAWQRSHCQV